MTGQRTYPHGVTCWIDTEQPDPAAASRFYAGLFGWTLTEAVPPGAPGSYLIATLDGQDVAAIAPASGGAAAWNTYVAVDDADATAAAVTAAGGTVVSPPAGRRPGRPRRRPAPTRPAAEFRLWQARPAARRPARERARRVELQRPAHPRRRGARWRSTPPSSAGSPPTSARAPARCCRCPGTATTSPPPSTPASTSGRRRRRPASPT